MRLCCVLRGLNQPIAVPIGIATKRDVVEVAKSHFVWQVWDEVLRGARSLAVPTPHSTLHTSYFPHRTPQSTRHTSHSTRHTSYPLLPSSHFKLHTQHFTAHTPHFTPHTLVAHPRDTASKSIRDPRDTSRLSATKSHSCHTKCNFATSKRHIL